MVFKTSTPIGRIVRNFSNSKRESDVEPNLLGWKFTRNKLRYSVDEEFFNNWTSQSAYLLGFTYADGNIYKTSLSWDIQKRDISLLQKIKKILKCTYPISLRHNGLSCSLRISNQILVSSLLKLGLLPKKSFRYHIPKIPQIYLRHFVRGYLDGDGWIIIRINRNEINLGFSGANREFLEVINKLISTTLNISRGKVRKKVKTTPNNIQSSCYQLEFYTSKAFMVAEWVYGNLERDDLFLDRKYKKYLEVKQLHQFLISGTGKVRVIQKIRGKTIEEILTELYLIEKLNGVEISKVLGVHSSSVYRWLSKTNTKHPIKRVVI